MTRLLAAPRRVLGRIRVAVATGAGWLALLIVPESSEEAAILVGMALLAGAFLLAGSPSLALGIPGALYVAIGLGFNLRRGR